MVYESMSWSTSRYRFNMSLDWRTQISFTVCGLSGLSVTRGSSGLCDSSSVWCWCSKEILAVVKLDLPRKQTSTPFGWRPLPPSVSRTAPYGLRQVTSPSLHLPLTWWTPLCSRVESLQRSTSMLSQRKGRAPQPSITWGEGAASQGGQPTRGVGGGVLHANTYMTLIRPIWLTVALGLKTQRMSWAPVFERKLPEEIVLKAGQKLEVKLSHREWVMFRVSQTYIQITKFTRHVHFWTIKNWKRFTRISVVRFRLSFRFLQNLTPTAWDLHISESQMNTYLSQRHLQTCTTKGGKHKSPFLERDLEAHFCVLWH